MKIAEPKKAEPGGPGDDDGPPPDPSRLLGALILLMGFFLAYPVLEATQAPISGLIYGFALWEAWKINKRLVLAFNGPYRLGPAGSTAPDPEVVDDEG